MIKEEIDRLINAARIHGNHDAIKIIISEITFVIHSRGARGFQISREFIELRDRLGMLVYKNWPRITDNE